MQVLFSGAVNVHPQVGIVLPQLHCCATLLHSSLRLLGPPMPSVNIRKQGGAAIMTIPAELLKELAVCIGQSLELEVSDGVLHARPATTSRRRRYSMIELLEGVTPSLARQMVDESDEWRAGPSVGRELP